jgi:hypothetical protein
MTSEIAAMYIEHHLKLCGVDSTRFRKISEEPPGICVLAEPSHDCIPAARNFVRGGGLVVAILPDPAFTGAFGIDRCGSDLVPPAIFDLAPGARVPRRRLRSLYPATPYRGQQAEPIITSADLDGVWLWQADGPGGVLVVGTDLAGDLMRYRQGDPAMADRNPSGKVWDFEGERPLHLFEAQLAGESPRERHADWWAFTLAHIVSEKTGLPLIPLLPNGAPGAIVLTGDDDQAQLEKYHEQQALLAGTPITYFLHPLTKHTRRTLKRMCERSRIELGIHPDALEEPLRYGELLHEQVAWFRRLVQSGPVSLRNHGFLSRGYWEHLPHWSAEGVQISSNIPGLDGRILNGSLLPARMIHGGSLTSHWSLLTAIGDGVVFVQQKRGPQAAECIHQIVDDVKGSGMPGVIVLNLHPQNVAEASHMHLAALKAIADGFHPWTMKECLAWFQARDGSMPAPIDTDASPGWWERLKKKWLH